MSKAEQAVLALVCGYADWELRRLGMFVAHVDESGKGDPIFVVACLTAMPGAWINFTKEWQAILHATPRVEYFKYSKAYKRAWFKTKAPKLLATINLHVERADILAIRVSEYIQLFHGKVSATYDNPFHQGYVAIMAQCLVELSKAASHKGKINFVFDRMTETEFLELRETWARLKKNVPTKGIKKLIGAEPTLGDDTEVVPLQGADLIAGMMWRACHGKGPAPTLIKGLQIRHRAFLWDESTLPGVFNGVDRVMLESGILYQDRDTRTKRLEMDRKLLRSRAE